MDGIAAYKGNVVQRNEWNFGTTKAVILINGKFLLAHRIRSSSGGSIVIIAKEGIGVDKELEVAQEDWDNKLIRAILVTDGKFYSSVDDDSFPDFVSQNSEEESKRLIIDGAIIAWQDFDLSSRSFNQNSDTSVEFYRYDPAILLDSNKKLWSTKFTWQEIAP